MVIREGFIIPTALLAPYDKHDNLREVWMEMSRALDVSKFYTIKAAAKRAEKMESGWRTDLGSAEKVDGIKGAWRSTKGSRKGSPKEIKDTTSEWRATMQDEAKIKRAPDGWRPKEKREKGSVGRISAWRSNMGSTDEAERMRMEWSLWMQGSQRDKWQPDSIVSDGRWSRPPIAEAEWLNLV